MMSEKIVKVNLRISPKDRELTVLCLFLHKNLKISENYFRKITSNSRFFMFGY